jgi:hypothetical protein
MCAHAGTGCSALMSATICRSDLVGVKLKLFSSGPQLKSTRPLGRVSTLQAGMESGSRRDLHFNVFRKRDETGGFHPFPLPRPVLPRGRGP